MHAGVYLHSQAPRTMLVGRSEHPSKREYSFKAQSTTLVRICKPCLKPPMRIGKLLQLCSESGVWFIWFECSACEWGELLSAPLFLLDLMGHSNSHLRGLFQYSAWVLCSFYIIKSLLGCTIFFPSFHSILLKCSALLCLSSPPRLIRLNSTASVVVADHSAPLSSSALQKDKDLLDKQTNHRRFALIWLNCPPTCILMLMLQRT